MRGATTRRRHGLFDRRPGGGFGDILVALDAGDDFGLGRFGGGLHPDAAATGRARQAAATAAQRQGRRIDRERRGAERAERRPGGSRGIGLGGHGRRFGADRRMWRAGLGDHAVVAGIGADPHGHGIKRRRRHRIDAQRHWRARRGGRRRGEQEGSLGAQGRQADAGRGRRHERRVELFHLAAESRDQAAAGATDLIVHVWRAAARRGRQRQHGGDRPIDAGETTIEQRRHLGAAGRDRRGAEHHDDEAAPVAKGAGHHVEAGGAGEAGLHAVDAGVASEQVVVIGDALAAERQLAEVEEAGLVRKLRVERAGEDRHVADRGIMVGGGQAVRVHEMRFVHAELGGGLVHVVGEALDGPADPLGDGDRDVVGRADHQHLQRVVERHLRADGKAHLRGGHLVRARRDDERRVHRDLVVADGGQRDVNGHQLRGRGREPGLRRLLLEKDVAGRHVHRDGGRRENGRRTEKTCAEQTCADEGEAKEPANVAVSAHQTSLNIPSRHRIQYSVEASRVNHP